MAQPPLHPPEPIKVNTISFFYKLNFIDVKIDGKSIYVLFISLLFMVLCYDVYSFLL